jgi:hypothetical protein
MPNENLQLNGNLLDGKHSIWIGGFSGAGHAQVMCYNSGDGNWWLGEMGGGKLNWNLVTENARFGNLLDEEYASWVADFTGAGHAQVMFYNSGDGNWLWGDMEGGKLKWTVVSQSAGFGNLLDGNHPIWIGGFSGAGHAQVMFYNSGDGNWWLGEMGGGKLNWNLVTKNARFGNLLDEEYASWVADFTGAGRAQVMFYNSGDGNWLWGDMEGGKLKWTVVSNLPPPQTTPPNPFIVVLGPTFSPDAPERTIWYTGVTGYSKFGCSGSASPTITRVVNQSNFIIHLWHGPWQSKGKFENFLASKVILPGQWDSSFNGESANGQWEAWGPESGTYTGRHSIGIDVSWICSDSAGSPLISAPIKKVLVALKTADGHYLTVVNGGGLGGPNTGPYAVAIHTDAVQAGPWETFRVEGVDATHFALKTVNGCYVTAINGGGMGGPNDATSPVHTDASMLGAWEALKFNYDPNTQTATIQAPNGRYLTAVNGGGFGGANSVPIHTNAVNRGPWELFSFVLI